MDFKSFIKLMLGFSNNEEKQSGKLPRARRIKDKKQKSSRNPNSILVNKMLTWGTWLLIALSLISLAAIIAMPLLNPSVEVPSILSQIITLTLGYFGGAISAFLRLNTDETDEGDS